MRYGMPPQDAFNSQWYVHLCLVSTLCTNHLVPPLNVIFSPITPRGFMLFLLNCELFLHSPPPTSLFFVSHHLLYQSFCTPFNGYIFPLFSTHVHTVFVKYSANPPIDNFLVQYRGTPPPCIVPGNCEIWPILPSAGRRGPPVLYQEIVRFGRYFLLHTSVFSRKRPQSYERLNQPSSQLNQRSIAWFSVVDIILNIICNLWKSCWK